MTKDQIRQVFLNAGFTIKDGETDLKDYVYQAANAMIQPSVERAERAEFIAGQLIEAMKITPHSVVVVRVKDDMDPVKAQEAFESVARFMPPSTTYILLTESFSLQVMDEDQMRAVGWVRAPATDPQSPDLPRTTH